MAEPETPRRSISGAIRRWGLVASLCLNVALIGLIAGAIIKRPPPPPPPGLWNYGRALPEPYRDDLIRRLRDTRHDWIGERDALRGQRAALADALVAAPYDSDAVAEVILREPRLMDALARRGSQLLLDQIDRMTPEDRAAYAEALRAARGKDRDGGRGGDHPPRGPED